MSGGSFNYAYAADDLHSFVERIHDWRDLRDAFEGRGDDDVAAEIDAMLVYLDLAERRITVRLRRLRDVARAMEWAVSGDYVARQLDEAVARWRGGETP